MKLIRFGRVHWLPLLLALVINVLVLINTIVQHPKIGYDVTEYITYMQVLPTRLPTPVDTTEFFSAPLPFFLPSLIDKVCLAAQWPNCRSVDGKFAQVINLFLSIGISVVLWKLAERMRPGNQFLKISMLAVLGILTVYYRTFSQARAEPYVAFFLILAIYLLLKILQTLPGLKWKDGLGLGVTLGLLAISRQWGMLIFPALGGLFLLVLWQDRRFAWRLFKTLAVSGLVSFMIAGWFYLYLFSTYGSFTAFNLNSPGFHFSNQPRTFYTTTGIKGLQIFKDPVRPTFDETLFPIFYSDTWGDYWGFFTYIEKDNPFVNATANGPEWGPYLGRVNLVSIFPSLVLLAGLLWGSLRLLKAIITKGIDPETNLLAFVFMAILCSGLGYMWFLISYPHPPTGNTNKATYMIQVFMLLPVLSAAFLEKVRSWKPALYWTILIGIGLVFIHNLPAMISRFNWFTSF
jgi:hypothetical protein